MTSLYQRNPSVEGVSLDQQEVLFHPTTNKLILVNPVGCAVWRQIEGACAPDAIADDLRANFSGVPPEAAAQVESFLAHLVALQFARTASSAGASKPAAPQPQTTSPYHAPALREVTEEEVLASFQMTAAEISAASCWWVNCATGCP